MQPNHSRQYQYVGMRLNKNIYSRLGVLVFPVLTILTQKDITALIQQDIVLLDDDVEHASILMLVDSAIKEIKEVSNKVKYTDIIPFENIRKKIIPIIINMSDHSDLKHILTHLEQHDEYTYRHSIGVALLSRSIGKDNGIYGQELLELTTAAFLHDIGKVKVPDVIINKPGKLTAEEFALVKMHTHYGFEIIKNTTGITHRQALVALQHHERENGSGYPFGIHGSQMDTHSKIVAVADVFHAMISKRVYKSPVPFYKVLQEMSDNAYCSLDPAITLSFLKRIMNMMIGNYVRLSNGCEGKIIMVNPDNPIHPIVEVNGKYIDLSKQPTIHLASIV